MRACALEIVGWAMVQGPAGAPAGGRGRSRAGGAARRRVATGSRDALKGF